MSKIKGIMTQPLINKDNSEFFARTRFTLRDSWNTSTTSGSRNVSRIISPFRAVNNAGDLFSRENFACRGITSPICSSSVVYGDIQKNTSVPASTCNVKFVYDGSDYTRFKKQQAINRTY